jgi:hypothetical protein
MAMLFPNFSQKNVIFLNFPLLCDTIYENQQNIVVFLGVMLTQMSLITYNMDHYYVLESDEEVFDHVMEQSEKNYVLIAT